MRLGAVVLGLQNLFLKKWNKKSMIISAQQLFEMYLDARRPIIYIRNFDFQSVDRLIEDVCKGYVIDEYSEADGRLRSEASRYPFRSRLR